MTRIAVENEGMNAQEKYGSWENWLKTLREYHPHSDPSSATVNLSLAFENACKRYKLAFGCITKHDINLRKDYINLDFTDLMMQELKEDGLVLLQKK